jgi:type IV secretion system protein TrbI
VTEDSDKVPPERLELRARPRPIRRLNKRTLMIGCALAALFIAGATIIALSPPRIFKPGDRTELYNTDRKQTADGLSKLPKSYDDLPPKLGPPSPGDVGRAFAESEKKLGTPSSSEAPFRANAEEDAERAERIRQTRIAQQAKESGLFFRLSEKQDRRKQSTPVASMIEQPSSFRPVSADANPTASDLATKASQGLTDRSSEIIPSSQARKLAFVSAKPDKETTNPHNLAAAPSPYAIMAGSIIPASLITGLNSDLPGSTIAQVTENVYDTVTGEHLLIPQGTRLFGKYDSVVAYGQKRALVIWSRLILPNGIRSSLRTCQLLTWRATPALRTKSTSIPGNCSRALRWQRCWGSALRFRSGPTRTIWSRHYGKAFNRQPTALVNVWSSVNSMCSLPSRCVRVGRYGSLFQRILC